MAAASHAALRTACFLALPSVPAKTKRPAEWLVFLFWQGQKDSNPRHPVLETSVLPTELYPYTTGVLYHTFVNKSRRSLVYHPQLVAVYHQCEALYIIKPQENTRWRVMRYSPAGLMIYTTLRAVMICQACGLDKKILVPKNEDFLAGAEGLEPTTPSFGDWCSTD